MNSMSVLEYDAIVVLLYEIKGPIKRRERYPVRWRSLPYCGTSRLTREVQLDGTPRVRRRELLDGRRVDWRWLAGSLRWIWPSGANRILRELALSSRSEFASPVGHVAG